MDCPFCSILSKEKSRLIREADHTFVIFSNPRLMKGHLLVIPKRHVLKLAALSAEEKRELFETVIEFQEKILAKLSAGCDIRQNCRPFTAQSDVKVDHLHFHLQPRELRDELYEKCQIHEKDIFHQVAEIETALFDLLKD